jgi:hypothetical protein
MLCIARTMVSRSASLTMFRTVLSNVETQTNKVSASNHVLRYFCCPSMLLCCIIASRDYGEPFGFAHDVSNGVEQRRNTNEQSECVEPCPSPHYPMIINLLEAASGFEPLNSGFANHCLTTWLYRPITNLYANDLSKKFVTG